MKYKIVLVPFPFDDLSGAKVRPAVCLTGKIGKYSHVIIAFITSRLSKDSTEYDITLDHTEETGLKVKSVLRLHRLMTIPEELIMRELGALPQRQLEEVKSKLKELFHLKK